MFYNVIKANAEISRLSKELKETVTDRDSQVEKLKDFEKQNADYIASAQSASQMQESHKLALETVTNDFTKQLADKDAEIAALKASNEKEVTTIKQSVAEETIRIVASQGTNVAIESVVAPDLTPEVAYQTFQSLQGDAKQQFYNENSSLILKGSPRK